MIVDTCCRATLEFFRSLENIIFAKSVVLRVSRRTYYRKYLIARYLFAHIFVQTNKTYFTRIYFWVRFKNVLSCVFIFVHSNFRLIKRKKATRKTSEEVN